MDKATLEIMKLQGKLRIAFIQFGVNEEQALDLAAEALHLLMISGIAKEEYQNAYASISEGDTKQE